MGMARWSPISASARRAWMRADCFASFTVSIREGAVAYNELVFNVKTDVFDRNRELDRMGFAQKSNRRNRGRFLFLQVIQEKMQGASGIYNVFHYD